MILSQLIDFLRQRGGASLPEIARALEAPPDAVLGMLETLQRRGLVCVERPTGCGTSCQQCTQAGSDLYRLHDQASLARPVGLCVLNGGH